MSTRMMPRRALAPVHPDVAAILKRFDCAKEQKERWRSLLTEVFAYFFPQRTAFAGGVTSGDKTTAGMRTTDDIFDSTAVKAAQRLAGRLQNVLYPAFRQWVQLEAGSDTPKDSRRQVNEQLEEYTDILFEHIHASNFSTAAEESAYDYIVGTGTIMCQHGTLLNPVEYNSVSLLECIPEEGPNGMVETMFRERAIAARNIMRLWPRATLGRELLQKIEKAPDEGVTIIDAPIYDAESNTYEYVVIYPGAKEAIFAERMLYSPAIVYRWAKNAGETLGRGPCLTALPSVRTLNSVWETMLKVGQMALEPPILSGDGAVNPGVFQFRPGTINQVKNIDQIREMKAGFSADYGLVIIENERAAIKEALFASKASPGVGPIRTATEWIMLQKELLDDIGGNFPRLYGEFLFRVVRNTAAILSDFGKLPPIRVDGKDVTVRFTGPLAQAQNEDDLLAFQRYWEVMIAVSPEVAMLNTKVEDLGEYVADKTKLPMSLIRDQPERAELQKLAAGLVAAQMMAAQSGGGKPAAPQQMAAAA